jgi:hypothetical protein
MTSIPETGGRTPTDQRSALGAAYPLTEDSPRWHLTFAEESMDVRRWGDARAALARARETIVAGSSDADEAAFVAVRLALAEVNLQGATAEVMALVERMDPLDPVWNRRVRRIISEAPAAAPGSMRAGLLDLLPPVPVEVGPGQQRAEAEEIERIPVPAGGLPELADDPWPLGVDQPPGGTDDAQPSIALHPALPPVPTESPFELPAPPMAGSDTGGQADVDELVVCDPDLDAGEPSKFTGRIVVGEEGGDLTDADALRERLVEEMLAKVTEEEGQLLFETATTFLNNGEPATAELMFSAAMQIPRLRVPACEGMIQALVAAERYVEAAAHGVKAGRLFASQGDLLTGIVYWHGVAAQALGDTDTAWTCFARVGDGPHAIHFPDLGARLAALAR